MGEPQFPSCSASQAWVGRWHGSDARPHPQVVGEGDRVRFAVGSRHGGEATADPARKQRQTLVGRGASDERRGREGLEVGGLEELLADVGSVVGRVGGVERDASRRRR